MPEALALSHDGRFLYAGGAGTEEGLLAFTRNGATGALSQAPGACVVKSDDYTSYDQPSKGCHVDKRLGSPLGLDLSPDGATVYVAAEESGSRSGGLSAYARDAATGALRLVDRERGPEGYYEVAVSPDGRSA